MSLNPLKSGSYPEKLCWRTVLKFYSLNPLKSGSYPERTLCWSSQNERQSQSPKKRVLSRVNTWSLGEKQAAISLNPLKSGSYPENNWAGEDDFTLEGLNPLKSGSYPEMFLSLDMTIILKCLNPLKSGSYPESDSEPVAITSAESQSPKKRVLSRVCNCK